MKIRAVTDSFDSWSGPIAAVAVPAVPAAAGYRKENLRLASTAVAAAVLVVVVAVSRRKGLLLAAGSAVHFLRTSYLPASVVAACLSRRDPSTAVGLVADHRTDFQPVCSVSVMLQINSMPAAEVVTELLL